MGRAHPADRGAPLALDAAAPERPIGGIAPAVFYNRGVFPLVFSAVAIVGLSVWLFVIKRRRPRERLSTKPNRSPVVVDRPYDPDLCDYCDEKTTASCTACTRPLCALHAPWRAGLFCATCEDEWEAGARRRGLIVVPLVLLGMAVAAGVGGVVIALAPVKPGIVLVPALLGTGAPLYFGIDRWMRRRFRRRGALASARQIRR